MSYVSQYLYDPPEPGPPPSSETNRSALGEVWSQLKAGAFSDLPRMAGQAMKYVSSPGDSTYDTGKGLVESADAIAALPEMHPGDTTGRPVVEALSKGARMIPQTVAPAVGTGLILSGVGAPAGIALIGGSALAAAPAGLAQAQDTYEKGLAKHGLTPEQAATMPDDPRVREATNASRMTGGIEFGGETIGGALAGRFLGVTGNVAKGMIGRALNRGEQTAAQSVLRSFTNPGTAARFGLNALETATGETAVEMGQGAGEAAVEQHLGYDQQTPWQAAKDSITPTLGMSALLLPFGIPAHASHAVKMSAITSALQNPSTPAEARTRAAEIVHGELAKTSPDAAANFAAHSFDAIHGDQETGSAPYGLNLDGSVLHPLTPRAIQEEQQPEPSGVLSRAVANLTPAPQPAPPMYSIQRERLAQPAESAILGSSQHERTNNESINAGRIEGLHGGQTGIDGSAADLGRTTLERVALHDPTELASAIESTPVLKERFGDVERRTLDKHYHNPAFWQAMAQRQPELATAFQHIAATIDGKTEPLPLAAQRAANLAADTLRLRIDPALEQHASIQDSAAVQDLAAKWYSERGEQSPFFRLWSRNAPIASLDNAPQVADVATGRPITIKGWHTSPETINRYHKEYSGAHSGFESKGWIWTATQVGAGEHSDSVAGMHGQNYTTEQFYQRMKNPKVISLKGKDITRTAMEKAQEQGHDGVLLTAGGKVVNAVVFEARDFKAVDNRGTFNPSEYSRYSIKDTGEQRNIAPSDFRPLDTQAHEAATSPHNDIAEPTLAQIEAGNYKKGHIMLHGLDIAIENPAGSTRSGTDETGRKWSTELKHHYGYIKGTIARDKDHIDVFVKPGIDPASDKGKVFVVDQKNTRTGRFDESKVLIGFNSLTEARSAYLSNYDASGKDRIKAITETTAKGFKQWLNEGDTKKPFTKAAPSIERQAIETAFPGQAIMQDTDGYTVALKNGATVRIATTGEISFDVAAAEAAYGRKMKAGERPVASFQQLDRGAVITLIDQGAGEIHHETFHTAMALALNDKQRATILNKFGTEEAAAAEYQRLRDAGAFKGRRNHHIVLQTIYDFFSKVRSLFDQTHGIMSDIASGKTWEQQTTPKNHAPGLYRSQHLANTPATSGPSATPVLYRSQHLTPVPAKYALEEITDKTTAIKEQLAAGEGLAAAWDGIRAAVNPMGRSAAAEEAGRILIEGMGRTEHNKETFITELNKATMQATGRTTRLAKAMDLLQTSSTLADTLFTRMTEAERIEFMQRMDTGRQQATRELQQVASAIRAMFEGKAKAVQALGTGALETIRDNYFPHAWDRSDDARKEINTRLSKRPLEGSKGFTKARVFEDINAGIEAGFKLVDTNPINLVFLKMAEMDKYINAHVALQAMEESGLVELIPAGERMPDGYGDISGKYGMVTKRAHQDSTTGEPGEAKSYRYIAREDVAQVFNNYLSQNLYNNKYVGKPFSAYMKAANMLSHFQLGVFSAFHAGFTSLEAVISHAALGIKALTRGDMQEAATYFKHAPAAWYLNPRLGDKVIKAWMGDEAAAKEMPQIIQWLVMAGARRIMDSRFQTDQTQKMFQAWNEGNKIGAGLRTIPAIVEQSARPILEWLVPRQKFGVFAEMANDWSQRNPEASHEETRKAMQQIWNRVDSRLGQVVYDRLFVHNVAKNLAQAIIRAPGWTGGTILEVGGGFKDLVAFGKDLATKGKKAELSDRAAYTLSLLTVTAIVNAVLTAAFTGEPPKDWKDLLAFRTGGKDEKGNPERFMLPTYMKDLYSYVQQPGTTLMHKTHPLLSLIGDLAHNKDYYGTEIRHQGDNPVMQLAQAGKFTAKAFIPFWMKGVGKEIERGGSVAAMAAPLIGIMPAPADLNKTAAERLAGQLVAERMPKGSKTQEEFERSQLIQHLTGLARRDPAEAAKEIAEARQEKKINYIQAGNITKNARLEPIQAAFKRLSFDEAQRVFEVATEAEKKKLRHLLMQKRINHLRTA